MIKFSTKTNFRIVAFTQFFIVKIGRFFSKTPYRLSCKRQGIKWTLDLNEVIDFMIYFLGSFDKESINQSKKNIKPTDIILDIGANMGSYALPLSKSLNGQGKIYAFEPSEHIFKKLQKNIDNNPHLKSKIVPIQAFIQDFSMETPKEVYASWNMEKTIERHKNHQGVITSTSKAISMSIDQFVEKEQLKQLDFIKIDVDGYEKQVLWGAQKTLENWKPKIFLELCPYILEEHHTSVEELLTFLQNFGYEFHSSNLKKKFENIQQIEKQIPKMGTINIFALSK